MSLPIINISPFLLTTSTAKERQEVAESVHKACIEFGFFYLTGLDSVVNSNDLNRVIEVGREFFLGSSLDEKKELSIKYVCLICCFFVEGRR